MRITVSVAEKSEEAMTNSRLRVEWAGVCEDLCGLKGKWSANGRAWKRLVIMNTMVSSRKGHHSPQEYQPAG